MELFSGKDNTLTVGRKYGTVYMCNLDLSLYPFDVQVCYMHFRISSSTKYFLQFDSEESIVNNSANRLLVEYEVGRVVCCMCWHDNIVYNPHLNEQERNHTSLMIILMILNTNTQYIN